MPNQSPGDFSLKIPRPRNPELPLRPNPNFIIELQRLGYGRIIGVDEVGRGALAGPVVVAAVEIYQPIIGVNDSKLIKPSRRGQLAKEITRLALQLSFGASSNEEIDSLGLSAALELAYQRCLAQMGFELVLTDNYHLGHLPHLKTVKGDQFFYPVAAASIVAKVYRDQLMRVYHQFHPQFGWETNVGYGTANHKKALDNIGSSSLHRQSFLKA